jgi:hypothetical protein
MAPRGGLQLVRDFKALQLEGRKRKRPSSRTLSMPSVHGWPWPDLKLTRSVTTPASKPRARENSIAETVGRGVDAPQGPAARADFRLKLQGGKLTERREGQQPKHALH